MSWLNCANSFHLASFHASNELFNGLKAGAPTRRLAALTLAAPKVLLAENFQRSFNIAATNHKIADDLRALNLRKVNPQLIDGSPPRGRYY